MVLFIFVCVLCLFFITLFAKCAPAQKGAFIFLFLLAGFCLVTVTRKTMEKPQPQVIKEQNIQMEKYCDNVIVEEYSAPIEIVYDSQSISFISVDGTMWQFTKID